MPDVKTDGKLNLGKIAAVFIAALSIGLLLYVLWYPTTDLRVSQWFFHPTGGFIYAAMWPYVFLHRTAVIGGWILGILLGFMALITLKKSQNIFLISARGWAFLFLALLIGPVIVTNLAFKDHWGRARPRDIIEFGGASHFTPPLSPTHECEKNCSFVSGDASFGFFLPAIAYIVPLKRSRRVFWTTTAGGSLFGLARIFMGAHFLSDVLFAYLFMAAIFAGLHAVMYGTKITLSYWREWFFCSAHSSER